MFRPFPLLLTALVILVGGGMPAHAQRDLLPDLESITAENAVCLVPLAMLGVDSINDVAWSPDGQTLLLAGSSGLWRYDVNQPSASPDMIEGYEGLFRSIAFSRAGRLFATGNDMGHIRLWDAETLHQIDELEIAGSTEHLVFSSDNRLLAAGTDNALVQVWDVEKGVVLHRLDMTNDNTIKSGVHDLAFSPDSNQLAVVGGNFERVINIDSGDVDDLKAEYQYGSDSVTFSPDNRWILTGHVPPGGEAPPPFQLLELWDANTRKLIKQFWSSYGSFHTLFFQADNTLLIGDSQHVLVMSLDEILAVPEEESEYYICANGEFCGTRFDDNDPLVQRRLPGGDLLALSPDESTLVAITQSTVRLIDYESGDEIAAFGLPGFDLMQDQRVGAMAFSPSESLLAYSNNSAIRLVDTETGLLQGVLTGHEAGVVSLTFSRDGTLLVSGGGGNLRGCSYGNCYGEEHAVRVWDIERQTQVAALSGQYDYSAVYLTDFSVNNDLIITSSVFGGIGNEVILWDWRSNSVIDWFDYPASYMAFSPVEPLIAILTSDSSGDRIELWNLAEKEHSTLAFLESMRNGELLFSPEGRLLAVENDESGVIHIWDIQTHHQLHAFDFDRSNPNRSSKAFSPDGNSLALIVHDGINVHNVSEGTEVVQITTDTSVISPLFFNYDGSLIYYNGELWNAMTGDRIAVINAGTQNYAPYYDLVLMTSFSNDGKLIAASLGGGVRLWGVPVGTCEATDF